jgi:hypothetical protein
MKTRHFFNTVTAALIAALFLMLTGCATTVYGNTTGDSAAVAQLAVDINANEVARALGDKATVNGDTITLTGDVTLTGGLRLENAALIVPSGVTLDLTADGAMLELRDGAVLTVNGTVNATGHGDHGKGWVEGSLRIDDGATVINGSGTIYLKSKGRLLNIGSDKSLRQITLDGVTLVGLADNDSSLVGVNEGGALVLKSGTIMGNTASGEDGYGGGVSVGEGAVFTMTGGTITGNTAKGAGGVNLWKGIFTMEGGKISDNTNTLSNAGVWVGEGSTFTMKGGKISGNSRRGVFVNNAATFIMEGGEISDNNDSGVFLHTKSIFTMSGGVIYGNTSTGDAGGVGLTGDSLFTMTGGRIQGSTDSDGFTKNTGKQGYTALWVNMSTAKWGTGGTYTRGGAPQTGGGDIVPVGDTVGTNDTLIAVPGK